ncbi:MAG: thioredoxin-disulfide reductase [Verrucomicrobiota bacterium]|nr:thioredoxin-disulfide reductase [Verrucomicrobiota bacterium]
MKDLVIIGSGPAGYTAAIYAARADLKPLLLTGPQPGGQLTMTTDIENFPGFPGGLSGFDLLENMKKQSEDFGTEIINDTVTGCDFSTPENLKIFTESKKTIETRTVIIATGASARLLGLDAEEKLMNKGVSACATCDGAFYRDVPVAVVGGGDTAVEEALFLTRFASKVHIIHRRDQLRASKIMAEKAKKHDKINICWDSVVEDILDIEKDEVTALLLKNVKTNEISTLECGAVFMAIGHTPNTSAFKDALQIDEQGYIKIIGQGSHTGVEGVFVAGDCADKTYRQAITAAGMGCKASIDAERYLEDLDL